MRDTLREAERRLASAGIESARLDARLLVAAALKVEPNALRLADDRALSDTERVRIEALLARRIERREPVSRILGRREFWSLEFRVTPHVLDPRPDSEILIEAALSLFANRAARLRVLDLGTGSGCLLLAALNEYPSATGVGVDASAAALKVAAENAVRLGLAARARFQRGDWGRDLAERFDLILCNPPYIAESERPSLAPEVARHDPPSALFAGPDGLAAYRAILPDVPRLLAPQGCALFEIGAAQAAAVSEIARAADLAVAGIKRDLAGRERCLALKLS
ncbi:MAG TPA: peptide chain release factor N(5)-glutamine methyltransferase [Alphaproteobacteria bacterium]